MSTHRRAWQQRAGVVVALVLGAALATPATPAYAAPNISNVSASPSSVEAGGTTKVKFTLTFTDPVQPADVSVSSNNGKLSCTEGCNLGRVDESGTYEATFRLASDLTSNGSAVVTIKAVDSTGPKQEQQATTTVSLIGKAAPPPPAPTQAQVQTVREISGKVTNMATGAPVPNATVALMDSQRHQYTTTTNSNGNYRFTGSTENPITPGRIELGATVNDIIKTKTVNASAGQTLTGQQIALQLAAPSASPSPETTAEDALPTGEATEETSEEPAAPAGAEPAAAEDDSGFGSYLLIILGGLFVAIGVGTMVLLWMKRRENADDDDEDGPAGAGAVPAARGAYRGTDDQTRIVNRMGAGPDPTMVGGAALADAPTMMHSRPLVDDVPPDPYGAPPQQGNPTYGAAGQQAGWAGNGYGDPAPTQAGYGTGGYGNAPASGGGGYGNAPASGGGYGSRDYGAQGAPPDAGYPPAPGGAGYPPAPGGAGYPPAPGGAGYPPAPGGAGYGERFDEPTGRYTGSNPSYPPAADPYATGVYQPPAEQGRGYGQEQQYGRTPEPTGGYGAPATGGGYGAPAGGGYDAGPQGYDGYAQRGGYDQQGGYDNRSGYGQQGGYDQPGGYGQPGYGQDPAPQPGYGQDPAPQPGGYDNRGYDPQGGPYGDQGGRGRPDVPPQQQDRPGRRLDWLDD